MNLYFVPALSYVTSQIMHFTNYAVFEHLKHPETVPCYATYKIKLFYNIVIKWIFKNAKLYLKRVHKLSISLASNDSLFIDRMDRLRKAYGTWNVSLISFLPLSFFSVVYGWKMRKRNWNVAWQCEGLIGIQCACLGFALHELKKPALCEHRVHRTVPRWPSIDA